MKFFNYTTFFLILVCVVAYFVSHSLLAGVIAGILSFFLIRFYLFTLLQIGKIKLLILLLNILKLGIVILMLFIFIRWLKLDALQIAIGYSLVFLVIITELFIKKPKEL